MTQLKRKSGGWHGFTLIELLVVIVIIGILASLAVSYTHLTLPTICSV